jgi:SAM-dependent methyltransferase
MPKSAQFLPTAETLAFDVGEDLSVYQCSGCGLVQLNNDPVFYFREVIRATSVSPEMRHFREKQFEQWIASYDLTGKKLLEVGCGSGEFIQIMNQFDVDVHGIEYGEQAVAICKDKKLDVEKLFLESVEKKLSNAPFDGFYMLNFLEHLPDPNLTLQAIHAQLTNDAIGLVEVPNFDMILRNNLFSEFISDHLFYFTRATLISTLTTNGFDVLACTEVWHDYSLSAIVRKRSKIDLTKFEAARLNLKNQIHDYLSQFSDNSVAIWGAGHQALAVMALTQLHNKIAYVVDSAKFKQGKYTPATHIPIVSPDHLVSQPIQAVIVMAASYSDEVASLVKASYPKLKLAILREGGLEIATL